MEATKQRATNSSEERCVVRWRYVSLLTAGYERRGAAALAERRGVDLHLAVDLLDRGCPTDVALDILL
jgi:hypothetical protein